MQAGHSYQVFSLLHGEVVRGFVQVCAQGDQRDGLQFLLNQFINRGIK